MSQWRFYIETYGCKVNQYESQAIREAWHSLGGLESSDPAAADYILINSCAITSRAERDARNAIFRLKRLAPRAKVILSGCAATLFAQFTPRRGANYTRPDRIISQREKNTLLHGPLETTFAPAREARQFNISSYARARAVVKIQDGCSQNCAYCIVPQTRGKPVSVAPWAILAECRRLLATGIGEIIISGVNLRQYGHSAVGDFWDLILYLNQQLQPDHHNRARLRISSLEPAQLTPKALQTLARCELVCPHIHLSLQHASPAILKSMGRGHYDMACVRSWVKQLRAIWPLSGLGADLLIGFPGETEADVALLADFAASLPLTYAHVFPYSRRPGTVAANLAGQIPLKIKKERAEAIRAAIQPARQAFMAAVANRDRIIVAPESVPASNGRCRGVNEHYLPCYFDCAQLGNYKGLATARPIKALHDGILVELLSRETGLE